MNEDDARPPSLVARGVSKTFGAATVLDRFDVDVPAGSVHCLLGHNGSGKSTFVKILSGFHSPDPDPTTEVRIGGRAVDFRRTADFAGPGVSFVHQTLGLVGDLTVQENLRLGKTWIRSAVGNIRWRQDTADAVRALDRFGVKVSPRAYIRDLSASERTEVAIVRAISHSDDIKLLVLDEATAALSPREVTRLFNTVRRVTAAGVGVLYVTHRLEEVPEIGDELTILQDGKILVRQLVPGTTTADLLGYLAPQIPGPAPQVSRATTGSSAAGGRPDGEPDPARPLREAEGRVEGLRISGMLGGLTMEVRPGEIVGVVGLLGSGVTELARVLSGAAQAEGTVRIDGKPVDVSRTHTLAKHRTALVVGDRTERVVQQVPVFENATLGILPSFFRMGVFRRGEARRSACAAVDEFHIRVANVAQESGKLSGGNQQKLALARSLLAEPRVLVLEEPFHGVDAAGRREIGRMLKDAAQAGTAVLVVDTDIDEIVGLCSRALVVRDGRVVDDLAGERLNRRNLMTAYHDKRSDDGHPA